MPETVSREQLEAVAAPEPVPAPTFSVNGYHGPALADVLTTAGIAYHEQPPDAAGITWYHLEHCPFHEDDGLYRCGVGRRLPGGPYAGKCFHNRGQGKGWQDFKAALGLDHAFGTNGRAPEPPSTVVDTPANEARAGTVARTYKDFAIGASALLAEPDDEPRAQIVEGLLGEGAVILAGRPKYGKSFLAFNLSLAIAAGGRALGERAVNGGDVLHLLLEDGRKRGKKRLRDLLGHELPPERLTLAFEWLRLHDGGIELIERWCADHPARRLIVIDTLKRVRPPEKGNGRLYDLDYDAVAGLADLAKRWNVAIVAVHHTRKSDAEDVFDTVSGSTGLTGAVDGVWVLRRVAAGRAAVLHVRDRDDEDRELGLEFSLDTQPYGWRICGSGEDVRMSGERARVLKILRNTTEALHPAVLTGTLGCNASTMRSLLFRMVEAGLITKVGAGYRPNDPPPRLLKQQKGTEGTRGTHATAGTGGTHEQGRGANVPRVPRVAYNPQIAHNAVSNSDTPAGHGDADQLLNLAKLCKYPAVITPDLAIAAGARGWDAFLAVATPAELDAAAAKIGG